MRIVLQSAAYWPHLGGVETVARLLAEEFAALGHEPVVLTDTPGPDAASGIAVLRRAPLALRAAALRKADVALMFGLGLRFLPLPLLLRRRTVVSHHGFYEGWSLPALLKRQVNRFTRNIAVSRAIAEALGAPSTVIANPYDDALFFRRNDVDRERDLVFVGRLVSDKGVALLIEALALLAGEGVRPMLTIVGVGPEEENCRRAAIAAGIERQIDWAGRLEGEALAVSLNRHRVLVAPSLCNEGFGMVALEGLASGCVVVGSRGGGLPEAIGPGGRTFPNGDAHALARELRATLEGALPQAAGVEEHLRRHSRRAVALRYLEVLKSAAAA